MSAKYLIKTSSFNAMEIPPILTTYIIPALLIFNLNGQSISQLENIPQGLLESDQLGNTLENQLLKADVENDISVDKKDLENDKNTKVILNPQKNELNTLIDNRYYGYKFFAKESSLDIIENLPAPDQYHLGPGDEIIITMWGDIELREKGEINRDGNIYFDRIGLVSLVGLRFDEAKLVLKSRFEKVYSSLKKEKSSTTIMEISLGKLKLMNIHFLGEVNNPGVIPIHPFSTITTALIQAGGISIAGSLRDIKIIREGSVITSMDYYQYFKSGDILDNFRLQNNDVISIPIRNSKIEIEGVVTHPGLFELKTEETLNDLIYFAGGIKFNAGNKVNIKRVLPIEYRVNEKNIFQNIWVTLPSDKNTKLMDGDKITIFPLTEFEQKVSIKGQVKQAGEFSIFENMKVSDLLELSGGIFSDEYWGAVYPFRADLIRKNLFDHSTKIIPIKLDKLKNGDQKQNLVLQNKDKLIIYPSSINKYDKVVEILGEVRNPGKYVLDDNMGLIDLILRSGGFKYDAYQAEIEIISVDPFNYNSDTLIQVQKLEVNQNIFDDYIHLDKYKLKNRDQVIVRRHPDFQYQKNIHIAGEIKFPGSYALESNKETLKKIIDVAGGLSDQAYINGLRLIRNEKRIIVDRLRGDKINLSIHLEEGDSIVIPKNHNLVEVVGEVNSPGLIQYKKSLSVMDYINIAGQLKKDGDKKTISIFYPNGESKGRGLFNTFPKIKSGCKIVVYSKPEELPLDKTTFFSEATAVIIQSLSLLIMADKLSSN